MVLVLALDWEAPLVGRDTLRDSVWGLLWHGGRFGPEQEEGNRRRVRDKRSTSAEQPTEIAKSFPGSADRGRPTPGGGGGIPGIT